MTPEQFKIITDSLNLIEFTLGFVAANTLMALLFLVGLLFKK